MIDKLLIEYSELFHKSFPLFVFDGDEEALIETLKKCIENKKPYRAKYEKDILY